MQRSTNTRRQTLGPVSMNKGVSQGGGPAVDHSGAGLTSKTKPPRGRVSMIPRVGRENLVPPTPPSASSRNASSTRRSSVSIDRRQSHIPANLPTKVDPRQIADKGFQQDCTKKLLSFLLENGYEYPISHKSLARPSGKDFNQIVTFLLRRVDPSFQDGSMKIEDEVSMNFKAMGYPFSVSKTSLVAAGSPHTWPSLLAALTWLIEKIKCLDSATLRVEPQAHFDTLDELESQTDRAFFEYLSAAYSAFLQGDENLTEELELSLAERFEKDDEIIEKEIEQMTDKNAVILEQIKDLEQSENDLQVYTSKRDGYTTDLEQFQDLLSQMDHHVDTLSQKKNDRVHEMMKTNEKLQSTNFRVSELKNTIRLQKLSQEDVQKIKTETKGIVEALDRIAVLKDQRKKELWECQLENEQLWVELEDLVSVYSTSHHKLSSLKDLATPPPPKIMSFDKTATNAQATLGIDFKSTVPASLSECKQSFSMQLQDCKSAYQEALDLLVRTDDHFSEALEAMKIVECKVDTCEATLNAERDAQNAKLTVRLREAESMESRVSSIRNPVALEEQMAGFACQCTELEALRIKYEEDNLCLKRDMCTEIDKAKVAIGEYDSFCQQQIMEILQFRLMQRGVRGNIANPALLRGGSGMIN